MVANDMHHNKLSNICSNLIDEYTSISFNLNYSYDLSMVISTNCIESM